MDEGEEGGRPSGVTDRAVVSTTTGGRGGRGPLRLSRSLNGVVGRGVTERGDSVMSGKVQFPLPSDCSEAIVCKDPFDAFLSILDGVSEDERRVEEDFTESNENNRRGVLLSLLPRFSIAHWSISLKSWSN